MKSNFSKRAITILMALILALSTGLCTVLAAEAPTGALTITDTEGDPKTASTFRAYQVIAWDAAVLDGKIVYTNMETKAPFDAVIGEEEGKVSLQTVSTYVSSNEFNSEIAQLANRLMALDKTNAVSHTSVDGAFSALPYGYYLVEETAVGAGDATVASRPILVCVPGALGADDTLSETTTIIVKTSTPSVEKKIVEGDALVDSNTAAIGSDVQYQIKADLPVYGANYKNESIQYYLTDTMSSGLTYKSAVAPVVRLVKDGATVALVAGTDYVLTDTSAGNGETTLKIDLSGKFGNIVGSEGKTIRDYADEGYQVVVNYTATLNEKAVAGNAGNPNKVNLTYSNNPDNGTNATPDDVVLTYTTKLVITKTDKANEDVKLAGAEFELYRKNGEEWILIDTQITGVDGTAVFAKLEQGEYKLVETRAPNGYNDLRDPIEFTVTANNLPGTVTDGSETITWTTNNDAVVDTDNDGILETTILNSKGFALPVTGGIGTAIFSVGGCALIAAGMFVFLKSRKKKAVQ